MAEDEATQVMYEDLAAIEQQFDEVDREILAKQYILSAPLYAKRQEAIAKIPNFWPLVFEQAPPDLDRFISPTDSQILAKLKSLEVTRFEVPMGPEKISRGPDDSSDPRSLAIRFEFEENEWFTDSVLEKKFWYRRSNDGWAGLVSEPVKINWKEGKDLTEGLTDAALGIFEVRKKAGDMQKTDFAAYEKLADKIESWNGENTSFFTWFGYVTPTRYVSAEESAQATAEFKKRQEKRQKGEKVASPEPTEEDMLKMQANLDVHEAGDELANVIAEDLWPGAIKYFTQAQEMEEFSELDFEDDMSDEEDDDDDEMDEPVDIRALVGKGKNSNAVANEPPKKKQKK